MMIKLVKLLLVACFVIIKNSSLSLLILPYEYFFLLKGLRAFTIL